jgi:hypothetical protein
MKIKDRVRAICNSHLYLEYGQTGTIIRIFVYSTWNKITVKWDHSGKYSSCSSDDLEVIP